MREPIQILQRVHEVIRHCDPSVFARGERWRPGGLFDLQDHLLHVIERAQRGQRAQRKDARSPARLCDGCFYRTPTGFCPQRNQCVLQRHADAVGEAIACATERG